MATLKKLSTALLVLNLIILNASISYLAYDRFLNTAETIISKESSCTEECSALIKEEIAKVEPSTVTEKVIEKETLVTQQISQSTAKTKRVSYITIPNSGSTLSNVWTSLIGTSFYLDKKDYPGLIGVYFEANMKLGNGNGKAYLRIYDMTHGIGANGSDVETSSQTSVSISSSNINLWEGNNQYIVQARSLTADTSHFESGRLKIVQEI